MLQQTCKRESMSKARRRQLGRGDGYRTARPDEINGAPFDRFTIGHAAVGVILGLTRVPWWAALGVAIGWELIERPLKRHVPKLFPHATQDTLPNALVDIAAMFTGWGVIAMFPKK